MCISRRSACPRAGWQPFSACRASREVARIISALEWRNWQTHETQNLALRKEHGGSTPPSSIFSSCQLWVAARYGDATSCNQSPQRGDFRHGESASADLSVLQLRAGESPRRPAREDGLTIFCKRLSFAIQNRQSKVVIRQPTENRQPLRPPTSYFLFAPFSFAIANRQSAMACSNGTRKCIGRRCC